MVPQAMAITMLHPATAIDAAPGDSYYYGAAPSDRLRPLASAWFENDTERGGPGPRVGAGSGMGVVSVVEAR